MAELTRSNWSGGQTARRTNRGRVLDDERANRAQSWLVTRLGAVCPRRRRDQKTLAGMAPELPNRGAGIWKKKLVGLLHSLSPRFPLAFGKDDRAISGIVLNWFYVLDRQAGLAGFRLAG
jgi:hypothetical protein